MRRNRIFTVGFAAAALFASVATGVASAHHSSQPPHLPFPPHPSPLVAVPDGYSTGKQATLAIDSSHGILANDHGDDPTLVANTEPSHGSLELEPDGSFNYVPDSGFTGTDSFSYSIADAVHLYKTELPPIGSFGGVTLTGGAFGSSLAPVPGHSDQFYGLEDRGPNVEAPNGHAVEPKPGYDPAIARFRFDDGKAELLARVPLQDSSGHPFSGLVNTLAPTGETIENLKGHVLAHDPDGYDPEGLVAMPDGSFWVSDEYGPFITNFNSQGREISRLSPFDGSLPRELANRVPNRGLEGLTITPDGKTLVAMMQSALQQPDLEGSNAKKVVPTRIVTYGLQTHALHEYLFLLDEPAKNSVANSEITALSNSTFLIDERDGNFPAPGGYKKLWKVDLSGATDVGPQAKVAGTKYEASGGGLLVGGKTLEKLTLGQTTPQAQETLVKAGVTPVKASLYLDLDALLLALNPSGAFFAHDKVEGVAALDGGNRLVISNDSDFGISGIANPAPPWQLAPKIVPSTGKQDDGEYLEVDMDSLPAKTSTATVAIQVNEAH
jgi:hypothetical protein